MKVAFDAKRALNNFTGLGNHARILLNALTRDFPDNDYLLYTPKANEQLFNELNGSFEIRFPETKFQQSFHPLWRSFGITRQLIQDRVNVFHGLSNELPFNIHQSGIKTVVTIHDLIFLKHTEQYPFIDRQIYKAKTKYAAKYADRIIAISRETKDDLVNFYDVPEKKIEVIYPAIDPAFQSADSSLQSAVIDKYKLPEKFILNVGSFFPRKNQQRLIEAFDLIKDKVEEHLVLIGSSGNERGKVEALIKHKNLQQRVKIISSITNKDLPAVYQVASMFVFPSIYEGFGAPVLEALFSKTPVIASEGGAIEEAGGGHSVFVKPDSVEDIADKMLNVLSDETLRKRMIEQGALHAQTMSDKVFADKTMHVYKELTE